MTKKVEKSIVSKKPFDGYYSVIGKACGCTGKYAKMVLTNNLGKYKNRNTELVRKILAKAEEIRKVISPNSD
ncbi:MAG: hypothetical protein H6537_00600 [Bacteroidales bacterium]|nr:hypothetical protein [Bacteroidales bacterium]HPD95366.1 hypothetical protein [Tenuifilaceae bacterium]HRX30950.1 hypothetical protein [Tenuifilaceae bacterium]